MSQPAQPSAQEILTSIEQLRTEFLTSKGSGRTVESLCDTYLEWSKHHNKQKTYEGNCRLIPDFVRFQFEDKNSVTVRIGSLAVRDLCPFHVTQWLDSHPAWRGSRRGAISAIKRVFNWSVKEGYIEKSPLLKLSKPPERKRERILTDDEKKLLLNNYSPDDPFRDFLQAVLLTGARPGEVMAVEASHVSLADCTWTFEEHKTSEKLNEARARVIYLVPSMVALTKRLIDLHPTGPLFVNRKGRPWNRNAIRCRFRRVRKKLDLGDDLVCYSTRHTWATDALERGVPEASVAELMGHVDTKMIHRFYSKLSKKKKHLQEMALRASGGSDYRTQDVLSQNGDGQMKEK
jgi:integrase